MLPAVSHDALDTLATRATHLLEVKHSRFLAQAAPVDTPEAALAFVASAGDLTATHNCWAYRIGALYRSSDDGEPAGPEVDAAVPARDNRHDLVIALAIDRRKDRPAGSAGGFAVVAGSV